MIERVNININKNEVGVAYKCVYFLKLRIINEHFVKDQLLKIFKIIFVYIQVFSS